MEGSQAVAARNRRGSAPTETSEGAEDGVVIEMGEFVRAHESGQGDMMRCVSSGYLSSGCSCESTVPAAIVSAAWAHELECGDCQESRFFHFAWRSHVWLAFGLATGEIRGVYCPVHRVQRDSHAAGFSSSSDHAQPGLLAIPA